LRSPARDLRDALAKLDPGRDCGRRRQAERSRIGQMLGRNPYALCGEKSDREIRRQNVERARQIRIGNVTIDAERQMRPMLLDRGQGQNRDPAFRRCGGDLLPGHIEPVAFRQRHNFTRLGLSNLTLVRAYSIVASPAGRSN